MGHYAIDKMNLRARETVYWPGITEDIKDTYQQCQICTKFARSQQKETLQSVETPHTRRELDLDIFSLQGTQYLLTFDYFSQFPVVRKLQSLHSLSVIKILKEIFTTVGIPRCIVSDSGTQFTSQEFKDFTRDWHIDHRITSPTNALMVKQRDLYRLSRTVLPKQWKEGKTYIWQFCHTLQHP